MTVAFWTLIINVVLLAVLLLRISPFDDTDHSDRRLRSGLSLYVDYRTGCQYIAGSLFGSLTPRLDRNGNHMCSGFSEVDRKAVLDTEEEGNKWQPRIRLSGIDSK